MRILKTLLPFFVILVFVGQLKAQDLHNSLFYMNPLHINPAFSGSFEGTYRVGGLYRDQARTIVNNAYSTPSFYIDAPIIMIGKRHWLGVGGLMFQDMAGDGKLRTASFQLSGAIHASIDNKSNNVLTLGVQWGQVQRTIKNLRGYRAGDELEKILQGASNPLTDDEVLNSTGSGGNPGKLEPEKSFTDINAGILLKSKLAGNRDFNIGVSARHITQPNPNFAASNVDIPLRITAHAQFNTPLKGNWSLTPEIYYTNMDPASQLQLHGWVGYMVRPEKNIKLNAGLGYRNSDAGQFLFGIDYGNMKAQFAYDITLSELNKANNYFGGFEIAIYYIGRIYKKPEVKPVILCPHL